MADVASDLKSWSATASSNAPAGSTNIGTQLDDNLREMQKVVRQDLATKGADIASATTTDLGAVAGLMHDITGTTTITGFGTVAAGIWKIIKFEGTLTLTHNATSLILPGGANITTANGDIAIMFSEGSGNWRCVSYVRAADAPLQYATQAQMETATSTVTAVSPGRSHFHPGVAKAWASISYSGGTRATLDANYNIAGIVDEGTGDITIQFDTDFSSTNYVAVGMVRTDDSTPGWVGFKPSTARSAGSCRLQVNSNAGLAADPIFLTVAFFGDQA